MNKGGIVQKNRYYIYPCNPRGLKSSILRHFDQQTLFQHQSNHMIDYRHNKNLKQWRCIEAFGASFYSCLKCEKISIKLQRIRSGFNIHSILYTVVLHLPLLRITSKSAASKYSCERMIRVTREQDRFLPTISWSHVRFKH